MRNLSQLGSSIAQVVKTMKLASRLIAREQRAEPFLNIILAETLSIDCVLLGERLELFRLQLFATNLSLRVFPSFSPVVLFKLWATGGDVL